MLDLVVAHSTRADVDAVLRDLREQLGATLDGRTAAGAFLFSAQHVDLERLVAGVAGLVPGVPLIGCTTDGELSSAGRFQEDSVALSLIVSDTVVCTAGVGTSVSADPADACRRALEAASTDTRNDARLCVTTPESLTTSGQGLLSALTRQLGPDVPVVGAVAGDYWTFEGTYQFFGDRVLTDSVPVMLLSGPLEVSVGVASGWTPIGATGRVTRSTGALVHEIDEQPAIDFYRRELGQTAMPTGDRPLALVDDRGRVLGLRAPTGAVDDDGGVTMFADVDVGSLVRLTVSSRDEVIEGCRTSIREASKGLRAGTRPDAALIFSCAARKIELGSRVAEESSILDQELSGVPFTGFYGYGEIGPTHGESGGRFHNETFVTVLLSETSAPDAPRAERPAERRATAPRPDPGSEDDVVVLRRRIERLERHRHLSEQARDQAETLYKNVIRELEESNRIILQGIDYASWLQRSILPTQAELEEVLSGTLVIWEPRDVVSGDLYWLHRVDGGHLLFLGDCPGHGIPGAFVTLIATNAIEQTVASVDPTALSDVLTSVHRKVKASLAQIGPGSEADEGIGLAVCFIPDDASGVRFAGARVSLFYARPGEAMTEVQGEGSGVGFRDLAGDLTFAEHWVEALPGRRFFLATDGLFEQVGGDRRFSYGKPRFMSMASATCALRPAVQRDQLYRDFVTYQGKERRNDDVTLIGFSL